MCSIRGNRLGQPFRQPSFAPGVLESKHRQQLFYGESVDWEFFGSKSKLGLSQPRNTSTLQPYFNKLRDATEYWATPATLRSLKSSETTKHQFSIPTTR